MLTNKEIKFIKSLSLKKNRDKNSLFVVEGDKIVNELINSDYHIQKIYATSKWYDINSSKIANDLFFKISNRELKRISNLKSPNNVLAVVQKRDVLLNYELLDKITLVLENLQDPGNLGTIIRSSHWFNISNIICSKDTVDIYNPKVIQSTMGSVFKLNIFYEDLVPFLEKCKNSHKILGAFLEGEDCKSINDTSNLILVVGNESKGISEKVSNTINKKITINKKTKNIDSLNVSIATSILLYELTK